MFFTVLGMILLCIIGGYFIMMGLVMFVAGSFYGISPINSWQAWVTIIIPIILGIAIEVCTFVYSPLTLSME